MCDTFKFDKSAGEKISLDFIPTFQPRSFWTWPKDPTYKWFRWSQVYGLLVDSGKDISRAEVLTRLLFEKEHSRLSAITAEERIGVDISHGPNTIKPVHFKFSQLRTTRAKGSISGQSRKHTAAKRTDRCNQFEENRPALRLSKNYLSEGSDYKHQSPRKPNMQPENCNDLRFSSKWNFCIKSSCLSASTAKCWKRIRNPSTLVIFWRAKALLRIPGGRIG